MALTIASMGRAFEAQPLLKTISFKAFRDPDHRSYRLLTLVKSLPRYVPFYIKLKTSAYGRIIPKGDPFFDRKFVTPYLATFFKSKDRLIIQNHLCDALGAGFMRRDFLPHLQQGITLWRSTTEGNEQSVTLSLPGRTVLEGDLLLEHRFNGQVLHKFSFSVVPGRVVGAQDAQVLFIGGSQGLYGTTDRIRQAAKDNGEINPANMLLIAARALAQSLGIASIYGVAAQYQPVVYAHADQHTSAYDDLWLKNDGEAHVSARSAYYVMPAALSDIDRNIEGRNKSRTRRKRRLKAELTQGMLAVLQAYVAKVA